MLMSSSSMLLVGIVSTLSLLELVASLDKVEFLFHNQALCGEPFAQPQWIPVLDICERSCKDNELCVENDELVQRCNKLPVDCVAKWKEMSAPPSTPPPTTTTSTRRPAVKLATPRTGRRDGTTAPLKRRLVVVDTFNKPAQPLTRF